MHICQKKKKKKKEVKFSICHFAKIYTLMVIDRNLWDYLKKTVKYQNFPTFSYCKTATRTTRKNMCRFM